MNTMTRKPIAAIAAVLAAVSTVGALPIAAHAQSHKQQENRQKTKNEWRNLSIIAGAATAYGLVKGNKTVGLLGAAGTLYSLNRYEQDRKSQSKDARERAEAFSRPSYNYNGHRYDRKIVTKNGQRYYQYVRR